MTYKVNPLFFRLGINQKQSNLLYTENIEKNFSNLNAINSKNWLYLLEFIKRIVYFLIHYTNNKIEIQSKNIFKNFRDYQGIYHKKKKKYKRSKTKWLIKQRKKYKKVKFNYHFIHPINILFENNIYKILRSFTLLNKEEYYFLNYTIYTLNISLIVFDQKLKMDKKFIKQKKTYISNKKFKKPFNPNKYTFNKKNKYILNKRNVKFFKTNKFIFNKKKRQSSKIRKYIPNKKNQRNFSQIKKDIDWICIEENIKLQIRNILNFSFLNLTKYFVFDINFKIKFLSTPYSYADTQISHIQKELEAYKPEKIYKILKNALYRSKLNRPKELNSINIYGMKIRINGRLDGQERARSKLYESGRISIKSYNTVLDFGYGTAKTKYGILGIKIWIDQGQSVLWRQTTKQSIFIKKNILIPNENKTFKKVQLKEFYPLQCFVNYYLDMYQYDYEDDDNI